MTPVVENFEIQKNKFSKWLYAALTFLSVAALVISWDDRENTKWIALAGVLLFGSGWVMAIKHKIVVYQGGFDMITLGKTRELKWPDITALSFNVVYHGHSVEARLKIQYDGKMVELPVKQYQHKPMQRFFEVLNEQCTNAIKNDHFIKQATGAMNWRNKLKMY